jgi:hypothetical protein
LKPIMPIRFGACALVSIPSWLLTLCVSISIVGWESQTSCKSNWRSRSSIRPDWYHAKDHLCTAIQLAYAHQPEQANRQLKSHETALYLGQASAIASWLDEKAHSQTEVADDLRKQATYFRNNHRRMRYLDYREDLWPIGSGMVESGCKQFQMRLKGPGMRWSRPGAERMLALHATIRSRRFDSRWSQLQSRQ